MASGALGLQQQRGSLETRIKLLINNDLKEICKAYNYQVSGTKAVLQKRCIEILDHIVKHADQQAFNDLNYRVSHHGASLPRAQAAPATSADNKYSSPGGSYNSSTMSPARVPTQQRLPLGGKYFKPSPFYEVEHTVLPLQDLPEMPQNRHTVKAVLALSPDHVARLKSDPTTKLLLYCGQSATMSAYAAVDIAFPNQLEVKINNDDVKANFKGLKNKPGSTKPADITDKVRKVNGYQNQLSVTYALTNKRFAFVVHLVKHVSAEVLAERIKLSKHGGGIITKQQVLNEMSKANADPDIAATSVRMSLKDPISTLRISLPVRSTVCTHNQCFDGAMFLALQDQAPQWSCPVCSKGVSYESLCVDKYFEEILQKTPSSIEKVDIEPNGEWRVIKEEEDTKPNGHSSKGGRASYDDDFDDDLIELTDTQTRQPSGFSAAHQASTSLLSPMNNPAFTMSTPPISSRGASAAPSTASMQQSNKRGPGTVIDLTSDSDDDDDPPRSAKRQATSTHHGNLAHYSTPSSLPNPRYTNPMGQSRMTDSHRQSSDTTRPSSNGRGSGSDNYGSSQLVGRNAAGASGTPLRLSESSSSPQHTYNGFAPPHSRPPSTTGSGSGQAFQPFAVRPAPESVSPAQQPVRLPPMQAHLPAGYSNWRSDYPSYSDSPPG